MMIVITVNTVTVAIVRNVPRIARNAILHCVWDVLMNVPVAVRLSAKVVQPNVRSVKIRFAWIV